MRDALRARILGVKELVAELEGGSRTAGQLRQLLAALGLAWEANAQVSSRLHWLESVALVEADDGKYRLVQSAE